MWVSAAAGVDHRAPELDGPHPFFLQSGPLQALSLSSRLKSSRELQSNQLSWSSFQWEIAQLSLQMLSEMSNKPGMKGTRGMIPGNNRALYSKARL